jgi:hypothetical protein
LPPPRFSATVGEPLAGFGFSGGEGGVADRPAWRPSPLEIEADPRPDGRDGEREQTQSDDDEQTGGSG